MQFTCLRFTLVYCLFFAASCKDTPLKNPLKGADTKLLDNAVATYPDRTNLTVDSIRHSDTTNINGRQVIAHCTSDLFLFILNENGDTLFKAPEMFPDFRFEDFNHDGFDDIRVFYMGNVPGFENLILYDPLLKRFKIVDGFNNFPDPERIKGTKFYYSYVRAGCADLNWVSNLFYLSDFQAVHIATIYGEGCVDARSKKGMYIYKIDNDAKKLTKKLSIDIIENYKDYKWGFLKSYWSKHYKEFL